MIYCFHLWFLAAATYCTTIYVSALTLPRVSSLRYSTLPPVSICNVIQCEARALASVSFDVPEKSITWERPVFQLLSQLVLCIIHFSLEFVCFLTLAVQLFTCKHCLQLLGLGMRSFAWNWFPVKKFAERFLAYHLVENTHVKVQKLFARIGLDFMFFRCLHNIYFLCNISYIWWT